MRRTAFDNTEHAPADWPIFGTRLKASCKQSTIELIANAHVHVGSPMRKRRRKLITKTIQIFGHAPRSVPQGWKDTSIFAQPDARKVVNKFQPNQASGTTGELRAQGRVSPNAW
eukprot:6175596-Pleurochrysis_carterae.AAC.1